MKPEDIVYCTCCTNFIFNNCDIHPYCKYETECDLDILASGNGRLYAERPKYELNTEKYLKDFEKYIDGLSDKELVELMDEADKELEGRTDKPYK